MRFSTILLLGLGFTFFPRLALTATFEEVAAQGGFYMVDNVPFEAANLKQAVRAVPHFNTSLTGNRCSAVILSRSGYVATNIHCLSDNKGSVLLPRWQLEPNVKTKTKNRNGFFKVFEVEERTPDVQWTPYIKSFFQMDNYIWSSDKKRISPIEMVSYQTKDVKVVWLGKGHQTHNEHLINDLSRDELDSLVDASQDIAILKYELKDNANLPCIPLAKEKPRAGDPVWTIGHPGNNKRENGFSSPGNSVTISLGNVRSTVKQDPIYQSYAKEMSSDQALSFWEKEKEIFEQDHLLLTSADIYGGNSGGAMINSNGELVALTYSVSKTAEDRYEGATAFGVRAGHIKSWLERDLGSDKAEEIFDCKN